MLPNTIRKVQTRLEQITDQLRKEKSQHSLSIDFDFPKEVSTACERYLLYFADFLSEIGIEASSDIKHEAGKVLFTVTPSDPQQALESIKDALEIYLEVAKYPIAIVTSDDDIISLKWKSAVETLQEELLLTRRALQLRTKELLLLEKALEHQYQQHSASNSIHAFDNTKPSERECVIPGLISVRTFEKGPVEIDIPNIVRWIKKHIFNMTQNKK
jgi:hypothetical protein